jgi:hypothetical protein
MSIRLLALTLLSVVTLNGCAHHRATKVDCDGVLKPINQPAARGSAIDAPAAPPVDSPIDSIRPGANEGVANHEG